jgi:glucose-6-phosphate 1-dehydrogenase
MAESFGVEGRGKFYEEAGALRDVVQNHMLQVTALVGMESPSGPDPEQRRAETARVVRAMRPLDAASVVRGQFRGYRQVAGVAPDSEVETFAALRLQIDNSRWAGVPFYIRAGKCLPVTATEVLVQLKAPTQTVFGERIPKTANYLRFLLSPQVVIAMGARSKAPGESMRGKPVELRVVDQHGEEMEPYERLLWDAAHGDATLFAGEDAVEPAWRVVDPVLGNVTPVHEYQPNTWGPTEADTLIAADGGWHPLMLARRR